MPGCDCERGAVCNTDHHLVVATMKFHYKSRARKTKTKRYDVGKLLNEEVERQEMCDRYLNEVLERTDEACKDDEDVAERWDVVRAALTTAAENVLGTTTRRQPDWFQESLNKLKQLLNLRNDAYTKWLGSGKQADLTRFKMARGEARRAVTGIEVTENHIALS